MTSLAEIESAAYELPAEEQDQLLQRLAEFKRKRRNRTDAASRERWMARLEALRNSIGTGRETLRSEQILDDLREERN